MELPNEPRAGEPLRAAWGAQVIRYLRSITSRESPDVLPQRGAGGTTYQIRSARPAGSKPAPQPFELINASEGTTPKIRVAYSTLGNAAPVGFSPGDEPAYVLTVAEGTGYVWAGVSITDGEITSRFLDSGSAVPTDAGGTYYTEIGSYSAEVDGGAVAMTPVNSRYGPIGVHICGGFDDVYDIDFY